MKELPNWDKLQDSQEYDAVCHTFFIVKDKDVEINWRKPYVQNSQIQSRIQICQKPFSSGAMRYAYYAKDLLLNQNLVVK